MPNEKTDSLGFSTENPDMQRDMAAKGGPTTTLGKADDEHAVPTPVSSDTQTQITAEEDNDKKEDVITDEEGIYPDKK